MSVIRGVEGVACSYLPSKIQPKEKNIQENTIFKKVVNAESKAKFVLTPIN